MQLQIVKKLKIVIIINFLLMLVRCCLRVSQNTITPIHDYLPILYYLFSFHY
jgi:hypothetical protein